MKPEKLYTLANLIITISFAMMMLGTYIGFVDHEAFTIPQQVLGHISIMVGAGLLKLSYVMRLNASMHLKINDFAPGEMEFPGEIEVS